MFRKLYLVFVVASVSYTLSTITSCKRGQEDNDGDGFPACNDCDDDDPQINPGMPELCDRIDNDCDGLIDDADDIAPTEEAVLYRDLDSDGFGDPNEATGYCFQLPEGYVADSQDCDDASAQINPYAQEVCDEVDNDCDGLIDDADDSVDVSNGNEYYVDRDLDGYGNADSVEMRCELGPGTSSNGEDCDDSNAQRNPGLEEICDDALDNDCNYLVDRNDPYCIAQEKLSITMTLLGPHVNAQAGSAVSSVGDINADGWPDMAIGAPGVSYETGAVYLYVSQPGLQSDTLYDTPHLFRGATLYSQAGASLGHTDVDGDERSDVLIGAPQAGLHLGEGLDHGMIHLFRGLDILVPKSRGLDEAHLSIQGEIGSRFGTNTSGVGDLDGDGLEEYVVSAPGTDADTNLGVYLFRGGETYNLSSEATAQYQLKRDTTGKHEFADVGDVNGDGFADLLIGSPENSGDVHLFMGGTDISGEFTSSDADVSFVPESSQDDATQIAFAGDIDEDGKSEILIGAPKNDQNGRNSGKTYLFFGADIPASGNVPLSEARYQFFGSNPEDRAGFVYDSGDVNKDGIPDMIIGAPGFDAAYSNQGKVYVWVGDYQTPVQDNIETIATQSIVGPRENARYGRWLSYVGDVNRKGRASILIGDSTAATHRADAGKAHLVTLQDDECLDCVEQCTDQVDNDGDDFVDCKDPDCLDADNCLVPEVCYDGQDNDGDGDVDCADQDCRGNSVCPVQLGAEFLGESFYGRAGWSVASAGDVDGDGLGDVLISSPNHSETAENNGKVYLLYGSTIMMTGTLSLQSADISFIGEEDGDLMGWSVASAGDVDNDGLSDIMMSAPWNNEEGENAGRVYIFLGDTLQSDEYRWPLSQADYIIDGAQEFSYLGKDMAGNMDVNGDGNNDIILGAIETNPSLDVVAKAYIVRLNQLDPGTYDVADIASYMTTDALSSDELLYNAFVDSIGDIDGDGLDDFALGSRGVSTPFVEAGGVYISYAASLTSSPEITPDVHIHGAAAGDKIGYVHSAGDIDGDGRADVLIGTSGESGDKTYVFHGSQLGVGSHGIQHAELSFDSASERFALLSDVDGDGLTDYLFHGDEDVYLLTGAQLPHYGEIDYPWSETTHVFSDRGGEFGNIANVGDINGDGVSDIFLIDLFYNSELGHIQWHQY